MSRAEADPASLSDVEQRLLIKRWNKARIKEHLETQKDM